MPWNVLTTKQPQVFDIPIIGDDFAKIGRAIDLYAVPCFPSAEIWVYGFFQAIPTMFLTILKPELIDISIRHRHGRPRKGRRYRFIAQAIFRDALIEIPVPRWVVFRIFEWGQRVAWYLLVADATETFAINWMSLAYKYSGCTAILNAYSHNAASSTLQGSGGSGNALLTWPISNGQLNFNFSAGNPIPAVNGVYRATYTVKFTPYHIPAQSQLPNSLTIVVGNQQFYKATAYESGFNERTATMGGLVDVLSAPRPRFAVQGAWSNPNKFCRSTGTFNVDRIGAEDLEPDP